MPSQLNALAERLKLWAYEKFSELCFISSILSFLGAVFSIVRAVFFWLKTGVADMPTVGSWFGPAWQTGWIGVDRIISYAFNLHAWSGLILLSIGLMLLYVAFGVASTPDE